METWADGVANQGAAFLRAEDDVNENVGEGLRHGFCAALSGLGFVWMCVTQGVALGYLVARLWRWEFGSGTLHD